MISVSPMMAVGGVAVTVSGAPSLVLMDALSEQIPSWATEVGMLTNGSPVSLATILEMSILLPPPIASTNFASDFLAASMALSMFSWSVPPTKTLDMENPASVIWSSTSFPAAS